ncbi:beta-galactosidase 4-like [Silene latifolia]|uniref:beta-galactosidase 4-like n=1 Tax=Silene latifolia TaxID=37657 RepID=UPI003D76C71C
MSVTLIYCFGEANVFSCKGTCATFLYNYHFISSQSPAWSISILPDCKTRVSSSEEIKRLTNKLAELGPLIRYQDSGGTRFTIGTR